MVEEKGLREALQVDSADANPEPPSRNALLNKIKQLYEDGREVKQAAALTANRWSLLATTMTSL